MILRMLGEEKGKKKRGRAISSIGYGQLQGERGKR
jgi:hypothetical protein